MDNIRQLAEKLVKTYPLEIEKYAPRHYAKVDSTGLYTWDFTGLVNLVDQHIRTADFTISRDLKKLAEDIRYDMLITYYL